MREPRGNESNELTNKRRADQIRTGSKTPRTTRTLRVRDRLSVPGFTDAPRASSRATSAEVAMLVLLLLPLVMVVVVVAMIVVVEVENGPALEEAGTATAPTPGLIPTRGPVDNATATPGSFRLFLSFSPCLCHPLCRPSSLPLLPISATPASGHLSCFFPVHAQHLFSSRHRRRLVLHILTAAAAPSAPTASLSHLTHATPRIRGRKERERERCRGRDCLVCGEILFPSLSLLLFLPLVLSLAFHFSTARLPEVADITHATRLAK